MLISSLSYLVCVSSVFLFFLFVLWRVASAAVTELLRYRIEIFVGGTLKNLRSLNLISNENTRLFFHMKFLKIKNPIRNAVEYGNATQ